jgi:hypothetical protein
MGEAKPTPELKIVILSGGTGRTAEQVVRSALAQFEEPRVRIVVRGKIRSATAAREAVRKARQEGAIVCHTFVVPKVREAVIHESETQMLPTVDIMGPILSALNDFVGVPPRGKAGLSYALNKAHFDRLDAVDFTAAHDDGMRPHELGKAEVVLVGVSRVSKSVTCLYLAAHGIRAANVPLVPDAPVPPELVLLDPNKVIGLTMNAERLRQIRRARAPHLGRANLDKYLGTDDVQLELRTAQNIMAKNHWRCIDLSYKSVEEVAQEILGIIR